MTTPTDNRVATGVSVLAGVVVVSVGVGVGVVSVAVGVGVGVTVSVGLGVGAGVLALPLGVGRGVVAVRVGAGDVGLLVAEALAFGDGVPGFVGALVRVSFNGISGILETSDVGVAFGFSVWPVLGASVG